MTQRESIIQCPIQGPLPFVACPEAEVTPLVDYLQLDTAVPEATTFPRGTLLPDGRLDLCKQNLGPDGCRRVASALQQNHQVRSLLLGTDGIGDDGTASIGELVESNSALQIIYLGCNGITETGTKRLAESLADNSSVEGLWLKRNPIGDSGAEEIAKLLTRNHSIRVLDLVNTAIGDRGVGVLCNSLKSAHCSIERMYLGGNAFSTYAASQLAEVLRVNRRLHSLLLNVNALGDEGIEILTRGLADNSTLRELGVSSNGITACGLEPLMKSVMHHPLLTSLDLGYSPSTRVLKAKANTLGDEGGSLIASMLKDNQALKRLNLSRTGIGYSGKEAIESALLASQTMQHCIIDGGLSGTVQRHLLANRERDGGGDLPSSDVALIRSVYRTAK